MSQTPPFGGEAQPAPAEDQTGPRKEGSWPWTIHRAVWQPRERGEVRTIRSCSSSATRRSCMLRDPRQQEPSCQNVAHTIHSRTRLITVGMPKGDPPFFCGFMLERVSDSCSVIGVGEASWSRRSKQTNPKIRRCRPTMASAAAARRAATDRRELL